MDIGKHETLEDAIRSLQLLRSHSPYRYGGKWHVSVTPSGQGVAYRSRADLSRRMAKEIMASDLTCGSYRVATVA